MKISHMFLYGTGNKTDACTMAVFNKLMKLISLEHFDEYNVIIKKSHLF